MAIKNDLAREMKIEPSRILEYAKTGTDSYVVILTNFQKFKDVTPSAAKPKPRPKLSKTNAK